MMKTSVSPGFQVPCFTTIIIILFIMMIMIMTIMIILLITIMMIMTIVECGDVEEERSSAHCPDFALTIDREQQCLVNIILKLAKAKEMEVVMAIKTLTLISKVLTLLGTRMTPAPNMHDIIMDLR